MKHPTKNKTKMTKEERRAKYTQIARQRSIKQRQRNAQKNLVCYNCRQRGHAAENCDRASAASKVCYKCGSKEHGLSSCPLHKKDGNNMQDLPFATCFVCQEKGHLASHCPQNAGKGIYVNGGSCNLCGSTAHLSKHCPKKEEKKKEEDKTRGLPPMEDYTDLLVGDSSATSNGGSEKSKKPENKTGVAKKKRVVKF